MPSSMSRFLPSPLWGLPNVLISPHLAGPNASHLSRLLPIIERNIGALLEGDAGSMLNQVPEQTRLAGLPCKITV
jgi:phosphoglycerate dehydrogenase-like enzyme